MHPVITMKSWAHQHHMGKRHEMREGFTQWIHGEKFWPVMGIILALAFMITLMIMASAAGPTAASHINYNSPYFYWLR